VRRAHQRAGAAYQILTAAESVHTLNVRGGCHELGEMNSNWREHMRLRNVLTRHSGAKLEPRGELMAMAALPSVSDPRRRSQLLSGGRAVAATRSYPPHVSLPRPILRGRSTTFATENVSTPQAAERLVREGRAVAALHFASAKHPGGGFLSGARAQESLARASGLYACLRDQPMYTSTGRG
jgi:Uncharacterized protein conserved in bacteria (DUF2263)